MSQQPVSVTPSLSPFQLSQSPYEAGWIEEGLYYRGETPPSGHGKSEDWVQIPHEGYIPFCEDVLKQLYVESNLKSRSGELVDWTQCKNGQTEQQLQVRQEGVEDSAPATTAG